MTLRKTRHPKKKRISLAQMFRNHEEKKKQTAQSLETDLFMALIELNNLKETYRVFFQRALLKARKQDRERNPTAYEAACKELKYAYSIYHYVEAMENTYRALQTEISIQKLNGELAGVVKNLRRIRLPRKALNYERLTAAATRNLRIGNCDGLTNMADSLMENMVQASSSSTASDNLIDDLIQGNISLETSVFDMPYMTSVDTFFADPEPYSDRHFGRSMFKQISSAFRR